MNYTLNQLKIYLKVVENKSITKAAEELHLTQPAVSIQLKNFTEQFDLPLIEVLNRRIYITDFGYEISRAVERVLTEINAINFRMHAHQGQLTGKLKISVVSTGKYVAPYFIADFMQQNQGIELSMDVTNKAQVIQSLELNEVDFSMVSVLPDNLNVEFLDLLQNKLFVVGPYEENRTKTALSKHVLKEMPLIYREKGSGTRYVMEQFIKQNNIPALKKMELTSNEAVKQAVIAGLGNSIMPLIGIRNELQNKQLEIINVKGFPIKSTWYLIWLKGKKLSPLGQAYLNYLKSNKSQIIHDKFDWYENY